MAQNIYQSGFKSFAEVANSAVSEIQSIPGFEDEAKASKLVAEAKELLEKFKAEGKPITPVASIESKAGVGSGSAKSLADLRLKQELAQLNQSSAQAGETKPAEPTNETQVTPEAGKENE
jgi:hypothetical protein